MLQDLFLEDFQKKLLKNLQTAFLADSQKKPLEHPQKKVRKNPNPKELLDNSQKEERKKLLKNSQMEFLGILVEFLKGAPGGFSKAIPEQKLRKNSWRIPKRKKYIKKFWSNSKDDYKENSAWDILE